MTRLSPEELRLRYGATTGDRLRLGDTSLWVKVGEDYAKLQGAWIKKFQPVLGSKGTIRFYQIESRLDLIVQAAMASEIPLVPVK